MTATANAEFLNEAIAAFWDFLNADQRYRDLGLKEFRLTDGKILPIDKQGGISIRDLPAVYVRNVTTNPLERRRTPYIDEWEIVLSMGVVAGAESSHEFHNSLWITSAVMTIVDVIGNRAAKSSRLNAPTIISAYDYEVGELAPVVREDTRRVIYWDAEMTIRLTRTRNLPAA